MREGSQDDTRDLGCRLLHVTCHGKGIIIGITRHTDNQVNIGSLQHLLRLRRRTDLRKGRWVAQSQFHILVKQFLVDTSVVLQHERVVGVSDNQDIEDTACHQIDKRHILQIKLIPLIRYFIGLFHIVTLHLPTKVRLSEKKTKIFILKFIPAL